LTPEEAQRFERLQEQHRQPCRQPFKRILAAVGLVVLLIFAAILAFFTPGSEEEEHAMSHEEESASTATAAATTGLPFLDFSSTTIRPQPAVGRWPARHEFLMRVFWPVAIRCESRFE
jgi:peptidoglycan/LPS O-acetylase OafA/YrhL